MVKRFVGIILVNMESKVAGAKLTEGLMRLSLLENGHIVDRWDGD